jgi:hypothetical protein
MALARVVSFEDVDSERMAALAAEVQGGDRPEGLPATEMILLHDPDGGRALAVMFFADEDDYREGEATLDAMPAGDTPGRRTTVAKYEVSARVTA